MRLVIFTVDCAFVDDDEATSILGDFVSAHDHRNLTVLVHPSGARSAKLPVCAAARAASAQGSSICMLLQSGQVTLQGVSFVR
ncbi:hypothetical protein VTO42DRAFT_1941 [Malbranchea cinnamomea]